MCFYASHQQAISPAFFFADSRLYAPLITIFTVFASNPSGSIISVYPEEVTPFFTSIIRYSTEWFAFFLLLFFKNKNIILVIKAYNCLRRECGNCFELDSSILAFTYMPGKNIFTVDL